MNNITHKILDNKLNVYFINKKDYKKKYVLLATNYGSNSHNFKYNDKEYHTPAGIAHFLEHKLFEMPDKTDAFVTLSKLGVNSNAYTSNNKTAYLFETTNKIDDALKVLLDFVYTPYFDKDSVEKEKGIIASEINMYKDYPDHQVDLQSLKNMYISSTLNEDIAGEVEDIMQTTPKDLYDNYNAFYNPSNMYLIFVGDILLDSTMNILNEFFKDKKYEEFNTISLDNILNSSIDTTLNYIKGNVIMPKFSIGIKNQVINNTPTQRLKDEFCFEAILYSLFSESSLTYQKLLDKKYITSNFYYRNDFSSSYSYAILQSDCKKPERAIEEIKNIIKNISETDITQEMVTLFKKSILGELYRCFDNVSQLGNAFLSYILNGVNIFEVLDIVNSINVSDVLQKVDYIKNIELTSSIITK